MRLVAVGLVLVLAGFASAQQVTKKKEKPVEYTLVTGDIWKVEFPRGFQNHDSTSIASPAGVIQMYTVRADVSRDLVVSVTHATYPERFKDLDPKTILDGVRDGLTGKDGKMTIDTDVKMEANGTSTTGKEYRVEAGRNAIRCRVFWVENRLFQVMAAGTKDAVGGPIAEHILKSFEVQP